MSRFQSITIRKVESSDLETFYKHQLDPEASRMAALVGKDPKDKVAFDAHWKKILSSPQITQRTIVADGQVAGHIACYSDGERMEVTYRLAREFWGRGLATQALKRMLHLVVDRPLFARAATDNIGSIRVLEKCGFKTSGKNKDFANGGGEDTEEYVLAWITIKQMNEFAPTRRWTASRRNIQLSMISILPFAVLHSRSRAAHLILSRWRVHLCAKSTQRRSLSSHGFHSRVSSSAPASRFRKRSGLNQIDGLERAPVPSISRFCAFRQRRRHTSTIRTVRSESFTTSLQAVVSFDLTKWNRFSPRYDPVAQVLLLYGVARFVGWIISASHRSLRDGTAI